MPQAYQHILTFTCNHQYFKDSLFRTINFSCPDGTLKLINDLGVVIKFFPGGFHLLSSDIELLASETRAYPFQFYLSSSDPYYINYSDLANFSPSKDLLYFNNLNAKYNTELKSLSLQDSDVIAQSDIVNFSHGSFRIPSFQNGTTYTFTDSSNTEISSAHIVRTPSEPDLVMLNDMAQGLVQVLLGDEIVHKVYHHPNSIWKKPIGTVELFYGEIYHHYKNHGKLHYKINFKNRETVWKYFISDPSFHKYEDLKIINKEKKIIFAAPEKTVTKNDSSILLFQSIEKIPLLEFTDDYFQLVEKFDEKLEYGKVVIKNLARASPDILYQENIDVNDLSTSETFYSHIYL